MYTSKPIRRQASVLEVVNVKEVAAQNPIMPDSTGKDHEFSKVTDSTSRIGYSLGKDTIALKTTDRIVQ